MACQTARRQCTYRQSKDHVEEETLRLVMPESERACPAGERRPWYVQSAQWTLRVTDRAHGLRLVGPPDYVIGP